MIGTPSASICSMLAYPVVNNTRKPLGLAGQRRS
jgi:hypothetical protein